MTSHLTPENRRNVIRIVAVYSLFGALWIYLSDSALGILFRDPDVITRIATLQRAAVHNHHRSPALCPDRPLHFQYLRIQTCLAVCEDRFSAITDTTSDGFYTTDQSGRFLDVNSVYCRDIGYNRQELLGMGIREVEAVEL